MQYHRALIILVLMLVLASGVFGQSSGEPDVEAVEAQARDAVNESVRITTVGGGSFQGRLAAVLDDRLELINSDGQIIQIAIGQVERVEPVDVTDGRRALYQDAAANRLVVMPTGFPMEQGEFHVTDQEIVIVTASYGLAPSVSLWGGISFPGLVLSGRFSFTPTETVGLSAGAFIGAEWFEFTTAALPYALASFGSPNRNVTLGAAGIFTFFGNADTNYFDGLVGAVGGRTVVTATAAVVMESWTIWIRANDVIYFTPSAIFRIAGNRLSWDVGAVLPLSLDWSDGRTEFGGLFDGTVIPVPLISVTYRID
jgi:hypothetical protein